jgi:hypothetical protein
MSRASRDWFSLRISLKAEGGPTCLTKPILRSGVQ